MSGREWYMDYVDVVWAGLGGAGIVAATVVYKVLINEVSFAEVFTDPESAKAESAPYLLAWIVVCAAMQYTRRLRGDYS